MKVIDYQVGNPTSHAEVDYPKRPTPKPLRTNDLCCMTGAKDRQLTAATNEGYINFTVTAGGTQKRFGPEAVFSFVDYLNAKKASRRYSLYPDYRRDMPVISMIYTPKGGVGKSTTTIEIDLQLQLMGFSTLLIDLDSQGSLSYLCGYDPNLTDSDATLFDIPPDQIIHDNFGSLLRGPNPKRLSSVIKKPYGEHGPHLIPTDNSITLLETDLREDKAPIDPTLNRGIYTFDSWFRKQAADPSSGIHQYDFILIDCPAQSSALVRNAMYAADIVIAPIAMDDLSAKEAHTLLDLAMTMSERYAFTPQLMFTCTFFNPDSAFCTFARDKLFREFGTNVSHDGIRFTTEFNEARHEYGTPLSLAKPTSPVITEDYFPLAQHLVELSKRLPRSAAKKGAV